MTTDTEIPTTVVDPVTVQVIRNAFVAAADEMNITMVKTAYNDLLYEVHDFGLVITDENGDLLAQSDTLPVFLAVLPEAIRAGIERFGHDGFAAGDIVLANDPYTTATHISDTVVYMPIFHGDDLIGFTACMAHWADIGGKSPGGWCPDSTDVFQEGLRFDHIRLARGGKVIEELEQLIWANVRLPAVSKGDLGAQIAACQTGQRRVIELYKKYGATVVREAIQTVFDQSEALMRAAIREISDGTYVAESALDHDGIDRTQEVRIRVAVTVNGDEIRTDLTGSSPTTRGPVNCPFPAVVAGVNTALKGLTIPFDRINAGHLRPLSASAPMNTVVNPEFPAPVDSYGYAFQLVADLTIRALSEVLPERCPAGGYPLFLMYLFRMSDSAASNEQSVQDSRSVSSFIYVDPPVGGSGASAAGDGGSALICLMDGDAPSPVAEMVESRYPVRMERYCLEPASGGVGEFRGGMGTRKEYRVLEDGLYAQISMEGTHNPGWGLNGGGDAQPCRAELWPGTDRHQVIADKIGDLGPFNKGDLIAVVAGGGGGWGDPLHRDPAAVADDVRNEFCTIDEALEVYGVVVDPVTRTHDSAATERERAERR